MASDHGSPAETAARLVHPVPGAQTAVQPRLPVFQLHVPGRGVPARGRGPRRASGSDAEPDEGRRGVHAGSVDAPRAPRGLGRLSVAGAAVCTGRPGVAAGGITAAAAAAAARPFAPPALDGRCSVAREVVPGSKHTGTVSLDCRGFL